MRTALIIVVVLAVVIGALWLGQRRLIYLPDTSTPPPAAQVFPGASDVALVTSDALRLGAWLVRPTGADRQIAVLLAPGNGGNRGDRRELVRGLSAAGFTVLVMDYRGYGGNPGNPTEDGLATDARAARAYLVDVMRWPAERIIYVGESLGSAVVARLATQHPPAGMVLRSPFVDLAAAGSYNYPFLPVRLLLRDRLPVAELVARVRVPTVVIYGTADTVIPPEQSREVAERAGGPVTTVAIEGADHNDAALVHGPQFIDAVVALVESIHT